MAILTNCAPAGGWNLGCRTTAGVLNVWVGAYNSNQMIFGLTASGEITSITGATVSFYQYTQDTQVASSTFAGAPSVENGTSFFTTTLQFTMFVMEQQMITILNDLMIGRSRAIYLDSNGNYWLLGYTNPVNVITVDGGSGKAYGDLNGVVLTLESLEPNGPRQISAAAALSVIDSTTFLGP